MPTKRDQYMEMREMGKTYQEIADHYDVTRQAVHAAIHFKPNDNPQKRGPKLNRVFNDDGKLQCNKCQKWLGPSRYVRAETPTGYAYTCKRCMSMGNRATPEKQRKHAYMVRVHSNGIEHSKDNLRRLRARFEEQSRWLLEYIKASEGQTTKQTESTEPVPVTPQDLEG